MNYVKEIFERCETQQITEFMRYGVDCIKIEKQTKTYTKRIESAHHSIDEIIKSKFSNMEEHEEIIGLFDDNIMEIKNMYMEIAFTPYTDSLSLTAKDTVNHLMPLLFL